MCLIFRARILTDRDLIRPSFVDLIASLNKPRPMTHDVICRMPGRIKGHLLNTELSEGDVDRRAKVMARGSSVSFPLGEPWVHA